MWVALTEEEKQKITRRRFSNGIWGFLVIWAVFSLLSAMIFGKGEKRREFVAPTEEFMGRLLIRISVGLLVAVVFLIGSRFKAFSRLFQSKHRVCLHCSRCDHQKPSKTCSCGGMLMNSDDYKWIDEGPSRLTPGS